MSEERKDIGLKGDEVLKCPMAFGLKIPMTVMRNDQIDEDEWEEYESYQTPRWHPENWLHRLRGWWWLRKQLRQQKRMNRTLRKINRQLDKLL